MLLFRLIGYSVVLLGSGLDVSACENPTIEVIPIQVEILSRGRGVPADTMRAYQDIKSAVEQEDKSGTGIKEQVLGLEGERRMCIVIENAALADSLFGKINILARDVELMRVSRAHCNSAPKVSFEEEDHEP